MDEELVRRWNKVVAPHDVVYYLGDFTLGSRAEGYVERLNGLIHFQEGSHDKWMQEAITRNPSDVWSKHVFIPPLFKLEYYGQWVVMCHYAMRSWPKSFHGSYQLYGHSHGRLESDRMLRQMDIGVDCHDFYPVSLESALDALDKDPRKKARD